MLSSVLSLIQLQFQLRRNFILIWYVSLLVCAGIFAPSFKSYYSDLPNRAFVVQNMQTNMSTRAMYGLLENPGDYGQMTAWQGGSWITILASVMAILLFNGMQRLSEDAGYTELVRSVGIPPIALSVATLSITTLISFALGFGTFVVLGMETVIVDELSVGGAAALGAVITLSFIGAALANALVAVSVPNAASANRYGLLALAASFIVRATADVKEIQTLNWLTPLGWRAVVKPYTDNNIAAIATQLCLCIAAGCLWFFLERSREYGRGILPERANKKIRHRTIETTIKQRWILERGQLLGWAVAVVVLSTFLTSLTGSIKNLLEDEQTAKILRETIPTDDLQAGFLAQMAQLVGILIAVAGVQLVLRLRVEERSGLIDLMRATGIRRWAPLGSTAFNTLVSVTALLGCGTFAAAFGAYSTADDPDAALRSVLYSTLGQIGPIISLIGLAVLLVGLLPKLANLAWLPVTYCALVVFLGQALELPDWAMDLSVFNHTLMAGELFSRGWIPLFMTLIGAIFATIGLYAANLREVK